MAIPDAERKLPKDVKDFITHMARYEDIAVAASKAKISLAAAQRHIKSAVVTAAIHRKQSLVENEAARLTAKAIVVDMEVLDNELLRLCKLDPEKHPTAKRHAIELGYRRVGMIREGEFVLPNQSTKQDGGSEDGDKPQTGPSFYRAFESRTTTTVHEVREIQAEVHAAPVKVRVAPPPGAARRTVVSVGLAD